MHPLWSIRLFCVATVAATLTACAFNPLSEATSRAINLNGAALSGEYKHANLVGVVAFDEAYTGTYHYMWRNALYMQGAKPGAPPRRYRVVPIGIRETDLFRHTVMTGAIVPDHLPLLRAGDVVEFRNGNLFDNMVNFENTREGNVVLRVVCWSEDPAVLDCARTKAPWKGYGSRAEVSGVAGTPYRDVASYGFTFSERYDDEGRVLPDAVALPVRPYAGFKHPLDASAQRD
jgi:hypothetical protein